MFERTRKAIALGRVALTRHSHAASGYTDSEKRAEAERALEQALFEIRAAETTLAPLVEDSQILEWVLANLPLEEVDPLPWVHAGLPSAQAWRRAILHTMHSQD